MLGLSYLLETSVPRRSLRVEPRIESSISTQVNIDELLANNKTGLERDRRTINTFLNNVNNFVKMYSKYHAHSIGEHYFNDSINENAVYTIVEVKSEGFPLDKFKEYLDEKGIKVKTIEGEFGNKGKLYLGVKLVYSTIHKRKAPNKEVPLDI